MTTQIVTVDIGGTHARFAMAQIAADGTITLGEPATLHTKDHASFQTAWEDFAQQQGGTLPDAVAIAVAGPVGGEVIRFTNNPWIIRPALIPDKLGATRYTVVNDFGAVGHAVARAAAEHFVHLAGPKILCPPAARSRSSAPAPGLALPMSGGTARITGCRRPRAGTSTLPRSTASRTRSWPACASAIAGFRPSGWSPAPVWSISMRHWPGWKAGRSSRSTTGRCGALAPAAKIVWLPLRLTGSASRSARSQAMSPWPRGPAAW